MAQLIMRWKNDGTERTPINFPEKVELKTFPQIPDALNEWLDIMSHMEQGEPQNLHNIPDYYKNTMLSYANYKEDMCYFLTVDGVPAASITVICDYDKKDGYIHMVACKPGFRGMGLGHLLNDVALDVLKREGMQTAYLTTDDWRIPAIKTYLKADFYPDTESEPDFKERWEKVMEICNN